MQEISEASTMISEEAAEDANVIWGWVIDEDMDNEVRVTVIATGFEEQWLDGKRARGRGISGAGGSGIGGSRPTGGPRGTGSPTPGGGHPQGPRGGGTRGPTPPTPGFGRDGYDVRPVQGTSFFKPKR